MTLRHADEYELSQILRACTSPDRDEEDFEDQRRRLLSISVIEIVKSLGEFLLSEDASVRREAVALLCWIVGFRADLDTRAIPHILSFFCGRLSDWSSVEFAVHGIRELYSKHISPATQFEYPPEDEAVVQKDRADLSLLLGYGTAADLPVSTGSVTERVLTKILVNVHAPSFGRQVRTEVLQLFKLLIKDFPGELIKVAEVVIKGLAIEGEDERDPSCLCSFFECIELLFETGVISEESPSRCCDELFDTLKSYFPIQSFGDGAEPELIEKLKSSMNRCLARFGTTAIEFLLPQLSTAPDDAYVAVRELGIRRPVEILPFLIGEWNTASPPLVESLLQASISASADEYITALLSRLDSKGENDLLVIIANTDSRIACLTIRAIPVNSLAAILPRLQFQSDFSPQQLETLNCNELAMQLINAPDEDLILLSRIAGGLTDEAVVAHLANIINTKQEIDENVGRCIGGLFDTPFASVVHDLVDVGRVLQRLVEMKDQRSVERMVLGLFRAKQFEAFQEILEGNWEMAAEAFRDSHFSCAILTQPSLILPSIVVGVAVAGLEDLELATSVVRKYIVERGQVDVLSHLPVESVEIVSRAIEGSDELLDLIAAVIASCPEEQAVRVVMLASAKMGLTEKALKVIGYCQDDFVWAVAIACADKRVMMETGELSNGRIEALIRLGRSAEDIVRWLAGSQLGHLPLSVQARVLCAAVVEELPPIATEEAIIQLVKIGDLFGFRLAIKYAIMNANWSPQFIDSLMDTLSAVCRDERVIVRFAAVQALSVLPEMIASGKLKDWKPKISSSLEYLISVEPKLVVRKQAALGITSWL